MTSDEITKYFENTEDHPKYKQLDTNTKKFYEGLIHKVKRHKIGEGDRGMKTVGEICLPKPKKELTYITLEGIPGKVIYPKYYKKHALADEKSGFNLEKNFRGQNVQCSHFYFSQLLLKL